MIPRPKLAKVLVGPSVIDGAVSRIVSTPRGGSKVETWTPGKGWVAGGATMDEFFDAPPAPAATLKKLGIPN